MRVPVQQRGARGKPATAANKRAKNKRGILSEGVPPVKIKKRKLQTTAVGSTVEAQPTPLPPLTSATTATADATNSVVVSKRKPPAAKRPVAGKKSADGAGKSALAGVPKKEKAKKLREPKLTAAKGKLNTTKKVSPTTEKKIAGVKAKKVQSRKLSGADLLVPTDADTEDVKDALISEKGAAESQVIAARKPQKKTPKAVVNAAAKGARGSKVTDDAAQVCRKKQQKPEKKVVVKRAPIGVKSIAAATTEKKKTRRKGNAAARTVGGDGEEGSAAVAAAATIEAPAAVASKTCAFPSSQLEVIDGVARNLIKGGYTWKKTKEFEENSAIKNKVVGSYKSKKQLTKKTPKNDEEIVKRESIIAVNPPTMSEEKIDKTPENDVKVKIVTKKALKEKKVETVAKKKVVFKKASPKVATKTATKVTFQVKNSPPKKRMSKKNKEALMKQQVASGSSFQDDYNSSTSDDCTLDLLLRRQKQMKQEELSAATSVVKSEIADVKPIIASSVKRETFPPQSPTNLTKQKIKLKTEKNAEVPKVAASILKKKVLKQLDNKSKVKLLGIKKQSPAVLKKLKLAARKKVIATKVKRMRPNEVSRLGSGTDSEQRARRMKLFGFWSGPKRHRVASLNALAKVHCLYENESRGALMSVCTKPPSPDVADGDRGGAEESPPAVEPKTEVPNADLTAVVPSTRTLRSGPGRRGIGQHWDQHTSSSSSSSSSDDSGNSDSSTTLKVMKKLIKTKPVKTIKKSKPRRNEVVMDLKDMVVRKRMASLNASAILSASYSPMEKLKKRGVKDDDSPLPQLPVEVELPYRKKKGKKKIYLSKKMIDGDDSDDEGPNIIELATSNNKKVATVIVNQDTDVTITGVYVNSTTHRSSTTHEGYCSIAGMQYRISSTSHTQTEATAVATETLLHAAPDLVPPAPSLHPSEPPLQQPIKSYTPLGALSNMQPPGGPLSPLGRRHGCSSAFSAPPPVPPPPPPPHHHHHHPPPVAGPPDQQPPYMHGYYQPAGPLISAHHHHGLPKPSALPPLEASPTHTPPTLTSAGPGTTAPPPVSASTSSGTRGGDESSDNDVVITATSCNNPGYATNPPNQAAPPAYRYQAYPLPPAPQHIHHQYPYTQYPQQYYPAGVQAVQYAGAPPQQHHYHNPELCYSAPTYPPAPPYYHKTYSTPPPVSYPRRYAPHPTQYYPPELYPQPPEQQGSRQMVATASTSGYQPPVESYPPPPAPPVVPMVDPYPPPPAPYYPGYPPPAPPCYSHSPPARSLAYIAYQCPCPMQSCPKNVHTGPLTGEGKGPDPSAAIFHHLPLPPVALALPSEPPHALGPPSPARGSAGMHPTPSPQATAQGSDANGTYPAEKRDQPYATQISSESRAVIRDLSSKNVGLLTIHHPQDEPQVMTVRPAGCVGTVYVGNNVQTLTRDSEQPLGFAKVDPKVEGNVKVEVGNGEGATKVTTTTTANGRKRKVKSENVAAPKPKRRNVASKRVAVEAKQVAQGDDVNGVESDVLPTEKTTSKNQPLSSANSCSLHNSKQNAKKRKLSNVEVLAENQEPAVPLAPQSNLTQAKEPKSRPKLCPSSKQEAKSKAIKVSKKSIGISEQPKLNPVVCDFEPVNECSNGIVTIESTKIAPKSASKSLVKGIPKSLPRMTHKTIMNINSPIQSRKKTGTKNQFLEISSEAKALESAKYIPVVNGKKLSPKAKLLKSPLVTSDVPPTTVASVKRRRKTDSDASKVSHMLRSHGMQESSWQTDCNVSTGNQMKLSPTLSQSASVKSKGPSAKKQSSKVGLAKSTELAVYSPPALKKGLSLKPKWSNGWCWEGEAYQAKVHLNSEETLVERLCYPSMRHLEGDVIRPLDCVLLKSGARKADLPFVAKVAQLWENPEDGEMMMSLLWYYRPEHTDHGRRSDDMRDEIFASKHKDANSVACIEDKCYVLTFNEYCRYRAHARRLQDARQYMGAVVPPAAEYPRHSRQPPSCVSPDMVFFCRRVYDFRQKRILKNPG